MQPLWWLMPMEKRALFMAGYPAINRAAYRRFSLPFLVSNHLQMYKITIWSTRNRLWYAGRGFKSGRDPLGRLPSLPITVRRPVPYGGAVSRLRRLSAFFRFTAVTQPLNLRGLSALLRFTAVNFPPTLRWLFTLLRFSPVMQPLDLRWFFALLRFTAVNIPPTLRRFFAFSYFTAVIISSSKEHVINLTY